MILTIKSLWAEILLNATTFGIVLADLVADASDIIPSWGTWLLIGSVVFLNIARAIGLKDIIQRWMGK